MTRIEVLHPGLQSTVQAGPRHGFAALGVREGGALDRYSQAVANLLVGNAADAPVLECPLLGPALRFDTPARIALCGAPCSAEVDGELVPGWRPFLVPAGSVLRVGRCLAGARMVLAIGGDWDVPAVLGSASTDLPGGFGGLHGRALRAGDVLRVNGPSLPATTRRHATAWWIDSQPDLDFHDTTPTVRVLPGSDATVPAQAWAREWQVSKDSNRQALRLQGEPLTLAEAGQRLSAPVRPGTVQLPADGQPILLLADAQSHGGYPRIGHVIRADLPRLAQLRPGQSLRLVPATAAQAHRAACAQRERLARIALAIAGRMPS